MSPQERKSLAEQLSANKLFDVLLSEMEARAIESLVLAQTEQDRVEAQWRVRSVRTFRSDCKSAIGSDRKRKAAPA